MKGAGDPHSIISASMSGRSPFRPQTAGAAVGRVRRLIALPAAALDGRAGNYRVDRGWTHRTTEVPTLSAIAAKLGQNSRLRLGFDTFDHDAHLEGMPEVDDAAHDRGIGRTGPDALGECLVDFQGVDPTEVAKLGERRQA